MGKIISKSRTLTLHAVKAAIAFSQPRLSAVQHGPDIIVRGRYLLFENGAIANPAGPISEFDIKMVVSERFPKREPKVFEVGGRIPRHSDYHINPDGDCCLTVWENWLVCAKDHSFAAFMNGPVNEYFLGQYWFEKTKRWPFGERTHGPKGQEEAYADALGIPNKKKDLIYHLRLLSKDWPKGHWPCPCGNGKLLRHCHRDKMTALHEKVPPQLARRMLRRVRSYSK